MIVKARESDEAFFFERFPSWHVRAAASCLHDAHSYVNKHVLCQLQIAPGHFQKSQNDDNKGRKSQHELYKICLPIHHKFDMLAFLSWKLCRWFSSEHAAKFAQRAIQVSRDISTHVPPCGRPALLISWLNA